MLNSSLKKYISVPSVALVPFLLYAILHSTALEEQFSLGIALTLAIVGELVMRYLMKSRIYSFPFLIISVNLGLTLLFWVFSHERIGDSNLYYIMFEILLVISTILIRAGKTFVTLSSSKTKNFLQKTLLKRFFDISSVVQYTFTIHIFGVLLYNYFEAGGWFEVHNTFQFFWFTVIPVLIILAIILSEILNIKALSSKLKEEEWIPIVTEKGEVTGKIAKSVSLNMNNKFRHPVVRIALVAGEQVYLQKRSQSRILDPGKLDYPFEKYMKFNHDINLSARNSISALMDGSIALDIKFIMKYSFENDKTKRLIFLFVARVENEAVIKKTSTMNGKFWSIKQIEEAFADEVFSECFELEFEYLKNMVLLADDKKSFNPQFPTAG